MPVSCCGHKRGREHAQGTAHPLVRSAGLDVQCRGSLPWRGGSARRRHTGVGFLAAGVTYGLRELAQGKGDRGGAHQARDLGGVVVQQRRRRDPGGGDTTELGVLGAGTFLRALELRKTSCGGAVEQHKRSGRPMVRRRRGIEQRTELTGEEVGSRFRRSTGLRSRQRDQVVSLAYGGSTAGLVVARGAAGRREHGGAGVLRGGAGAGCAD